MAYANPRTMILTEHEKWLNKQIWIYLGMIQEYKNKFFLLSEENSKEKFHEVYESRLEHMVFLITQIKRYYRRCDKFYDARRTRIQARIDHARAAARISEVHSHNFDQIAVTSVKSTAIMAIILGVPDATHGSMLPMGSTRNVELLAMAFAKAVARLLTPERDKELSRCHAYVTLAMSADSFFVSTSRLTAFQDCYC